jgi:hypothetical protein
MRGWVHVKWFIVLCSEQLRDNENCGHSTLPCGDWTARHSSARADWCIRPSQLDTIVCSLVHVISASENSAVVIDSSERAYTARTYATRSAKSWMRKKIGFRRNAPRHGQRELGRIERVGSGRSTDRPDTSGLKLKLKLPVRGQSRPTCPTRPTHPTCPTHPTRPTLRSKI